MKNLKNLRKGTIIELDKLAGEPLDVIVDNEYSAYAEAVAIDDNYGVRITGILADEEPEPVIQSNEELTQAISPD